VFYVAAPYNETLVEEDEAAVEPSQPKVEPDVIDLEEEEQQSEEQQGEEEQGGEEEENEENEEKEENAEEEEGEEDDEEGEPVVVVLPAVAVAAPPAGAVGSAQMVLYAVSPYHGKRPIMHVLDAAQDPDCLSSKKVKRCVFVANAPAGLLGVELKGPNAAVCALRAAIDPSKKALGVC
jgi:hypothetical protein